MTTLRITQTTATALPIQLGARAGAQLIVGVCLLPTPLLGLGVALVALGVAFLAIAPTLQTFEDEADERIATEQALGRSGCGAMFLFCVAGVALLFGVGVVLTIGTMAVMGR